MIVVVETNFIVELVLQQEQSHACDNIVALCSSSAGVRMVIPAFAVAEAGMNLENRTGKRRTLVQNDLPKHAREMGRSKPLRRVEEIVEELRAELGQAELEEASRWLDFRVHLEDLEIIPLTAATFAETVAIQLGREIQKLPDAIILASLKGFLEELRGNGSHVPVLFVSRDDDAFTAPAVLKQLRVLGCTYINSFVNAEARIRSHLETVKSIPLEPDVRQGGRPAGVVGQLDKNIVRRPPARPPREPGGESSTLHRMMAGHLLQPRIW
jgi:hypothetical protein